MIKIAISYVNDREMKEISKQIISLSDEFNTEINNLFKRLNEVPTITREWVGTKSNFYFNRIYQEKAKYNNFANNIKDIGRKINYDINEINNCMINNSKDETEKGY